MRHCFYHTDLGQNALFHNFSIQINPLQWTIEAHVDLYGQPVLTFAV